MTLICLGRIPWDDSWKRNQSMVYELSKLPLFARVVFVNHRAVWIKDLLLSGSGTFRERLRFVRDSAPWSYDGKIRICSMFRFMPLKKHVPWGERVEERLFASMIRRFQGPYPSVLLNNHPVFFSRRLLDEVMQRAVLRIFDLSDDFIEFHRDETERRAVETGVRYACANSDLVFTVNEHLRNKYADLNPNMYTVPNATNFDNFNRPRYRTVPFLEEIRSRGEPILGYSGIINGVRVDYALLEALASRRPHCRFVFIGSADPAFFSVVERHPNIHHHPWVPVDGLADCIRYFDAAVVPFRVNAHTLGNDLLKFNDYLAMGKPIVTTDMGGARRYEGLLWIASGPEQFLAGIDEALGEQTEEMRRRRMETASGNSWPRRVQEIQGILLKHLPPELVTLRGENPC